MIFDSKWMEGFTSFEKNPCQEVPVRDFLLMPSS